MLKFRNNLSGPVGLLLIPVLFVVTLALIPDGPVIGTTLVVPYKAESARVGEVIEPGRWDTNFLSIENVVNSLDDDNYKNLGMTASTKIIAGTVSNANLGSSVVTSSKISNGTIIGGLGGTGDIAQNTINGGATGEIKLDTITGGNAGAGNVKANTITGGTTGNIALNSVEGSFGGAAGSKNIKTDTISRVDLGKVFTGAVPTEGQVPTYVTATDSYGHGSVCAMVLTSNYQSGRDTGTGILSSFTRVDSDAAANGASCTAAADGGGYNLISCASEAQVNDTLVPVALTLRAAFVRVTLAPAVNIAYSLRIDGVSTALCTVLAAGTFCSVTGLSTAVGAGARVDMQAVASATNAAVFTTSASICLGP